VRNARNTPDTSQQAPHEPGAGRRPWQAMSAADFGEETRPVQGALFQEPDPVGTLDLFDIDDA
jgi:hypothetical protein